jgi:hypothetical protein
VEYRFVRVDERGVWGELVYGVFADDAAAKAHAATLLVTCACVLVCQGDRRLGLVAGS